MGNAVSNLNPVEQPFSIDRGKENMIEYLINWQYFQRSKWKIFPM